MLFGIQESTFHACKISLANQKKKINRERNRSLEMLLLLLQVARRTRGLSPPVSVGFVPLPDSGALRGPVCFSQGSGSGCCQPPLTVTELEVIPPDVPI